MKRSGYGLSIGWAFASIRFSTEPGIEWRLHMSKIAAQLLLTPSNRFNRQ
jgi:hypothetical protein